MSGPIGYRQLSSVVEGVTTDTTPSVKPGTNEHLVVDWIMQYGYFAGAPNDWQQIAAMSVTGESRTLWYMKPCAAFNMTPSCQRVGLALDPGEWLHLYQHGAAANTVLVFLIWYHIEPIDEDQPYVPPTRYACTEVIPGLCL